METWLGFSSRMPQNPWVSQVGLWFPNVPSDDPAHLIASYTDKEMGIKPVSRERLDANLGLLVLPMGIFLFPWHD